MRSTISHWLPIVTRCPVNGMPDVLYAYVEFEGFVELYAARSALFSGFFLKMMFMEDVAQQIAQRAKSCGDVRSVTLRLATSRHVVRIDCA